MKHKLNYFYGYRTLETDAGYGIDTRNYMQFVEPHLKDCNLDRVLVAGLGAGAIVEWLCNEHNSEVVVVERDPYLIAELKPWLQGDISYWCMDIFNYQPIDLFDTIILDIWYGVTTEASLDCYVLYNQLKTWGKVVSPVVPIPNY